MRPDPGRFCIGRSFTVLFGRIIRRAPDCNNHFEGHAPGSIEKLKRIWKTGFTEPPNP